jgi:TPR repeat protein
MRLGFRDRPGGSPRVGAVVAVLIAVGACASHPPPRTAPAPIASSSPATGAASSASVGISSVGDCDGVKGTPETVALFEKACNAKDGPGCFELAKRLWCGAGIARDHVRAVRLAEQACDEGVAAACANAALGNLEMGDRARAFSYADKGCKGGDIPACNNVALMLMQGPAANPQRAAQMFNDLCAKGNTLSCGNLSMMYWLGLGVEKDLLRAKALAAKACDAGILTGCNTLGAIATEEGPEGVKTAIALFDRVCNAGDPNGCDNLGQVLTGAAAGAPDNKERAAIAFKRACDLNFAKACTHLAQLKSE